MASWGFLNRRADCLCGSHSCIFCRELGCVWSTRHHHHIELHYYTHNLCRASHLRSLQLASMERRRQLSCCTCRIVLCWTVCRAGRNKLRCSHMEPNTLSELRNNCGSSHHCVRHSMAYYQLSSYIICYLDRKLIRCLIRCLD